jgi:hypothetical protein
MLELVKTWVPIFATLATGVWAAWTYFDNQERQQAQQAADFIKTTNLQMRQAQEPFIKRQLDLYFETAQVVGKLVTLQPNTEGWKAQHTRFWQLFWTELSLVEHDSVKKAMESFSTSLEGFRKEPSEKRLDDLQQHAYRLSQALRGGIYNSWISGPEQPIHISRSSGSQSQPASPDKDR